MERFPPIPLEQLNAEQRAVHDAIASGPRGSVRGPFVPLLHSPGFAQQVQSMGEYLRFKTKLPPALLEFAIIITARSWSAHYEWFAHEKLARSAGLEPAIIDAIAAGREPESMSDDQRIVHSFVTQVHRRGTPDDAAFVAARDRFGLAGTLDLLGLCGYYSIVAMVLNTAQIMPEGAPPLAPLDRNYP